MNHKIETQLLFLDRMRADCDYYLGLGNRDEDCLLMKSVSLQILTMWTTYESLSEEDRPDWLSVYDICEYERRMLPVVGHMAEKMDARGNFLGWQHNEKTVIEESSGKVFTLTQPQMLFDEDTYHIRRCIAVENVSADIVPERPFYVYEIVYMPDGYCCQEVFVSEDFMASLLKNHAIAFLQGKAREFLANVL